MTSFSRSASSTALASLCVGISNLFTISLSVTGPDNCMKPAYGCSLLRGSSGSHDIPSSDSMSGI